MRAECGKIQTRKTPNTDTLHAVESLKISEQLLHRFPLSSCIRTTYFFFQQSVFIKRMRPDYIINHIAFYFGSAHAGNVRCLHH